MSNTGQFDAFAFLYLNPSLNLQSVEEAYTFALSNSNDIVGLLSNLSGMPNTFTTSVFIADNRDIINISGLNTAIKQSMLAEGFSSNTIDAGGKYYSTIFRDINLVGSNTFAFSNQYPYANSNFKISVSNLQPGDKVKIHQNNEGTYFYANVLSVDSNATPKAFTFSMLYPNEHFPVYTGSNPDSNIYSLFGIKLFDADRLARIEYLRLSSNNPYVVANLPTDEFNYELYKVIYPDTRLLSPEDAFENYKSYLGTPAFRVAQFQDLKNFQGLTGFCNIGGTNMTTIIPFTMCNHVAINPPATLTVNCPTYFNGSMMINNLESSNGKIINFTSCNALLFNSCNISLYASNANIDEFIVNYNASISNLYVSGLTNLCNLQANQAAMSNVHINTAAVSNMTAINCSISNGYVASLNASNSHFIEEYASNIYASNIYVSNTYASRIDVIDSYMSNIHAKNAAISNVNVSGSAGISNLYALNSLTSNAEISVLAASNSYLFNANASNLYANTVAISNVNVSGSAGISNLYALNSLTSNASISVLAASNSYIINVNASNLSANDSYLGNVFANTVALSNVNVSGSAGISNLYALNSLTSNASISSLAASNSYIINVNASNLWANDSYLGNVLANIMAISNVNVSGSAGISNLYALNSLTSNASISVLVASNSYIINANASNLWANDSYLSNVFANTVAISNVNVSGLAGISNLYALNSLTSNANISVIIASNAYLFDASASNFRASNADINLLKGTLVNINTLYNSNSYTSNIFASNASISNMDVNIMNSDWNYGANFVISDFGILSTLSNGLVNSNQAFDNVLINQTLGVTGETSMGQMSVTTNDVMLTCHGMIEATNLNSTSDIRLKQNVNYSATAVKNALDIINSLRPCEYEYKHKTSNPPKFGFIADEVQHVLPSIVGEIPSYISYIDKEVTSLSKSIIQNDGFNLDIGDIVCINGKQHTVINVSEKCNTFKIHPPLAENEQQIILKGVLYDNIKMIDQLQMIPLLVSAVQQLTQMVHQLSFSGKSDV